MDLREICAASPYLSGLIFAAEDFALDLSLTRTPSLTEFLYARSAIVTAARAFELPSTIDLVCTAYKGDGWEKRLEDECRNGREMGFNGKRELQSFPLLYFRCIFAGGGGLTVAFAFAECIHPSQVRIVQHMFRPGKAEIEWAVRVVIADEKASAAGRGAWTLDGKMIDAPVVGKARAVVAKAERCGFDVDSIRQEWQHQEAE
jgi:citrate lyase subunit beta-like protein